MTDYLDRTQHAHPLHVLVSWPAVIAGAVVAVAVGAMLNLLGVALGAGAFNPYDLDGGDAEGFAAAAGMWAVVANSIALFVGGAVASRAAKYADHHKGALHGLSVWAVAFLLAILIASGSAAVNSAGVAGGEATRAAAGETIVGDALSPDRPVADGELVVAPTQRAEAENTADSAATLALWGFLTMLLSGIAAVLGGLYGTRNHRWMAKAGLEGRTVPEAAREVSGERDEPHKVYPTPRS
ncbi:hypothetical protein [Brevundimonas sp. GCM10030266]|uniref:hypothetical protein n=1 Tax=Brevundimonas sp. GCM10030266 TaxID=3273386 RepID=UPI003608A05D